MIVSHKHKFVFVHIPKNGGTTIRTALDPYADLYGLNKITPLHPERDQGVLAHTKYEENDYATWHPYGKEIKNFFAKNNWKWDEYYKFAIVRNPWDRKISFYSFLKLLFPVDDFSFSEYVKNDSNTFDNALQNYLHAAMQTEDERIRSFVSDSKFKPRSSPTKPTTIKNDFGMSMASRLPPLTPNAFPSGVLAKIETSAQEEWFTDEDGNDLVDAILRFENLQTDFDNACRTIGISCGPLPHLNKSLRSSYKKYYNDEEKAIIAKKEEKIIKRFGYEFGK